MECGVWSVCSWRSQETLFISLSYLDRQPRLPNWPQMARTLRCRGITRMHQLENTRLGLTDVASSFVVGEAMGRTAKMVQGAETTMQMLFIQHVHQHQLTTSVRIN